MSNKKFKFKAVPTGGSVPAPGSVGNSPYTLFAKQLSATTFTPIVTDGNGKALEMVTSSGGGGSVDLTPYARKDAAGMSNSDAQNWANTIKPYLPTGGGGGSPVAPQNIQKTIETGNTYTFSDATTHLKHDFKNTSFEVGEDNTYKSSINLKKDSIKIGYEIPGQFNGIESRDFNTTIYSYELFIKGDRYNNVNNPAIDKVAVVNYQTGRVNTLTYAEVGYKIVGANNEIFIGTDNSTGANTNRTANVSVGTDNFKSLAADSTSNIAMGYSAGKSTTGSRNTFLGTFAGYNQKNGSDNVFIGYNAGGGAENSTGNVFIGANVGTGLRGQVSLDDIKQSSPIFEEYTKDTNLARDLGFDTATQKFNSTANILIGYQSTALNNTINRAIGSIGIGYQPLTGAGWRLYNSINIGHFIYGGRVPFNYYNVITIGNHIRPGSTYGSLHIDNGIDKRISSADTLIWGQFENAKYSYKKQLKINGIFSLNTSYMEKADDLRNHRLLVRQDVTGQVKYVDISDLPFTKPNPNLLRSSSLPMMAPNDTGTGISSIQEEATGKFVRYTPTAGKRVWLYGFKFPGNGNGKYSRSVLVRHNHTADLTVWGQTVKPNTWTRIKQDAYTSTSEWQIFDIVTTDVVVDLKQYKLEESPVSTDWVAHVDDTLGSGVEEAPADGKMYVRQNGRWVQVTKELLQNLLN